MMLPLILIIMIIESISEFATKNGVDGIVPTVLPSKENQYPMCLFTSSKDESVRVAVLFTSKSGVIAGEQVTGGMLANYVIMYTDSGIPKLTPKQNSAVSLSSLLG
jgi:hypothetical protein